MIIIIFTQKARWARGFHADTFCSIKLPCISALTFKFKCLFLSMNGMSCISFFWKRGLTLEILHTLSSLTWIWKFLCAQEKSTDWVISFGYIWGHTSLRQKHVPTVNIFLHHRYRRLFLLKNSCSSATFHEIDFSKKIVLFHYYLKP